MIKNYIKTAFRNFWKNRFYTLLNVLGLATGLSACLLILLYVGDELSYDHYNKNADRIYRINQEIRFGGNHAETAQTPPLLGAEAVKEIPGVEQYTRLRWTASLLIKKGKTNIREERIAYADSTLFEVFSLPMISGNPKTALAEPHSMVITESTAKKYFDRTDLAGRYLVINDTSSYRITGVIKDIPQNSHFHFNIFLPLTEHPDSRSQDWFSGNYNTYLLVKKGSDISALNRQLNAMLIHLLGPELKNVLGISLSEFTRQGNFVRTSLVPLKAIHLYSNTYGELDANGNIQWVYIFSLIAFFILIIACVNFTNLFTAQSSNRAREVGVRKVLGSLRKNLVQQFLTESLLVSFMASSLAVLMAWLILPWFNQVTGKNMRAETLLDPLSMLIFSVIVIFVGLLAGSYPAFILSGFRPIEVLKGRIARGFKGSWLRNSLVVLQFSISVMLIAGTGIIYSQLRYIRTRDIGFDRQQVLIIHNTDALKNQAVSFKQELMQLKGVAKGTMTGYLPVNGYRNNNGFFTTPVPDAKNALSMQSWYVDPDYIPTLGIQILQGRNFSQSFLTDSSAVILNEAAARFLGSSGGLNKKIYMLSGINTNAVMEFHIIGIIRNFNFNSLRESVTPLALFEGNENGSMALRVRESDISQTLEQIKKKWQAFAPGQPFGYSFMDDDFDKVYSAEQRTGEIFVGFASLAIFIACLGLFGLVAYAAQQRLKEIGIRKVLGASVIQIVSLLSIDFLKLIFLASVISIPLAWWAMNRWLQDFAYRVPVSWMIFALAGSSALAVAMITISFQAIKAARVNPINNLRTE